MLFGKNKEKTIESKELLKKASRSSPKRLKELLKQIEAELVKGDNYDLQIAKTIITSRLTSM
ncbi:MAG: hypothetical protein ACXVHR_02115, partial [Methanobacterium sp.]